MVRFADSGALRSLMSKIVVVAVCVLLLQLGSGTASAVGFGVLGDSLSDEYVVGDPALDPWGTHTNLPALNWVQLLSVLRGLDFGAYAAAPGRIEPRTAGYAHNWARSGGTADEVPFFLPAGADFGSQVAGITAQVESGEVEIVVISIGHKDYFYRNFLAGSGTDKPALFDLESEDYQAFEQGVLDAMMAAVDAVFAADADAKVLFTYLPPDTLNSVDYVVTAMRHLDTRIQTEIADRIDAGKTIKLIGSLGSFIG
jgi:hypothetical protein